MVRDGYMYGLGFLAVAAAVAWIAGNLWWGLPAVLLAAFLLWFFRDPERLVPAGRGLIVSPADGLVTEATTIVTPQGPRQRVSIFLSVFDVHVNRAPVAGVLSRVEYRRGKFLNAMSAASAEENERNVVTIDGEGVEIVFKQIAGLIARRIVFPLRQGDRVERGQRVGMIKFGSRTDVILPADAELQVRVGKRVKGASSVIAIMPSGAMASVVPERLRALSASVEPELAEGELQ
jgi:phosphatidylserine decarboxylase